ncbi:negative elongation factor A [Sitodiplosis mosellana]|uniref:negative elongation factor A n=1 Tax=Sitodiplosis mosellana TaxID=263140 RepID=UPI0024444E2F|nr:negative elongation factor A [Sitodiplosis mosellana]XP_055323390.1 negative elongation factor A [Sitodiplosis mosellana]XP_055323391.1 negative elongation factor A [Sitodiplosis mosellana]
MAANRDSDTSLWLHNKLGTSSEWTSGSICSQLNKEVLRNIKDCFADLQTQVKLKLLLSFFHIPRRLVEEWKTELDEVIEVAALDSELWVSMIAETIKTFPATGSLNTEISDYEETRPIFTDMVNELRKYVNKHSDLGMLPLECQYLNKMALTSVVGQQPPVTKHFTLKRKPKSAALRAELLQKSSDAQSSLKKSSAPIIPLRTRGMPRKMTDTTPLRGIPTPRIPTSGFRSPTSTQGPSSRPNMPRQQAGRKDGGIKILDITEQPLGYAAAKKRKRQQELEEQQKRALEAQSSPPVKSEPETPVTTTPDYAVGLTATSVYTQPATPAPTIVKEIPPNTTNDFVKTETVPVASSTSTIIQSQAQAVSNSQQNTVTSNNNHLVFSIKNDGNVVSSSIGASSTPLLVTVSNASSVNTIKSDGPRLISSTTIKPATTQAQAQKYTPIQSTKTTPPALVTISSPTNMPSLAALSNPQQQQQHQQSESLQVPQQIGATKIVQIKTAPTIQVVPSNRPTIQNIPPLIPTQQPTFLNIQQSVANRQSTIQTNTSSAPSTISYITTNQTDAKPLGQTFQTTQQQQPKYSPVVVQSPNVKGKTIILANANTSQQKTIILRSVGADGNTILQQVPISSVSGLQNLTGNTNNIVLTQSPGTNIIKTSTTNQQPQFQQIQITGTQQPQQQIPALVPTSYTQIITNSQQPQNQQQPQTRLVLTNPGQNQSVLLPQGLTLIQRPGQQPQLVQTIQQNPQIVQIQQQQNQQSQPVQMQQVTVQQSQAQPQQRKGLTLSNEHVAKLNEIFSQANRVTRRDKALILGFMGGCRENPMPSPENYIVIKLGETEERVKQEDGTIVPMLVESLIKLDYNTGEWKKLQHLRRIDQQNDTKKITSQNSVVI